MPARPRTRKVSPVSPRRGPEIRDRQPEFEALSVVVAPPPGVEAMSLARSLLRRMRMAGWRAEPVELDSTEFELIPPRRRVSHGRAWNLTYAMRGQPEVVHAEPLFRYLMPEMQPPVDRPASRGGYDDHDPATATDYEWSLRKANVLEAWRLFGSRPPGAGVEVGHPDTGYTPHPELADPARLLVTEGYDYDDDDPNPLDDLSDGFGDNPGHGTGTGSVILSGAGTATGRGAGPFVSGVAPYALLIPIRVTESVVLLSMRALRKAIDHATTQGAHVVSISLGGPWPSSALRRAIDRAVETGVIVLAAAGNSVGWVVFPAAFEAVIAVAASNIRDKPWSGSSHGSAVDITAPGQSVWRARTVRDGNGHLRFGVERGTGTSFAVATTAGVAALWISYHGWTTLVRRYNAGNVARTFKQLLQKTCRVPKRWDSSEYGPGIVDARRLLAEPLPRAAPARKLRDPSRAAVAVDTTGIETLVHLMPSAPRTRVEAVVADLLNVTDRQLPRVLQEVGDELIFQLVMRPALMESLEDRARGGSRAAPPRRSVKAALATADVSNRLRKRLASGAP